MPIINPLLCLLSTVLFMELVHANTAKITLNYGLHHGTGYFEHDDNNDVTAFVLSGAYKPSPRHTFKLSSSYNRLKLSHTSSKESREGMGDTQLSYKHRKFFNKARSIIDIETKLKIPTANEDKGLGTGKTDSTLIGGLYQRVNRYWLYTKLGHKWRGDSATRKMNNGYFAKLGLTSPLGQQLSIGGNLAYHHASSPRSEDRKEALLHLGYKVTKHLKTTFYTVRGFTQASPKWAGGILIRHQIN